MLVNVLNNGQHSDINRIFNDSLVQVPYDSLDHFELLEKLPTSIKHLVGKHVLFTIDPEIWESFLS